MTWGTNPRCPDWANATFCDCLSVVEVEEEQEEGRDGRPLLVEIR